MGCVASGMLCEVIGVLCLVCYAWYFIEGCVIIGGVLLFVFDAKTNL